MKKNIIYTAGFCATLLFSQCAKKLDELKPYQSFTSQIALGTPDNVKNAVTGVYGIVRGATMYGGDMVMSADLLGGNSDLNWRGTFFAPRDVYSKGMVADNGIALGMWDEAYNAINSANSVLENINVITNTADRNLAKGEVQFLRALCYFDLARYFGQPWDVAGANTGLAVPLMLKANDFSKVSRATLTQVYAQVLADLTEAESILPTTNGNRANKYTAKALLARVYLQQGNYAQALAKAQEVIASNKYSLNVGVTTLFDGDNTPEAIFEIQQNSVNNAGQSNGGIATFYANMNGIGRGDVEIRNEHLALYETGDTRKADLFYVGTGGKPGETACGKWKSPTKNYNIIRLAEMILIRAEANFRLASSTGATVLDDINQIRNRAGLANLATATLAAILKERQLELCFEGHRIHDIKRLKQNVVAILPAATYPFDSPKLVMPIPLREMDVNPNLVQNVGY